MKAKHSKPTTPLNFWNQVIKNSSAKRFLCKLKNKSMWFIASTLIKLSYEVANSKLQISLRFIERINDGDLERGQTVNYNLKCIPNFFFGKLVKISLS